MNDSPKNLSWRSLCPSCGDGHFVPGAIVASLQRQKKDVSCPKCGTTVGYVLVDESHLTSPNSIVLDRDIEGLQLTVVPDSTPEDED